MSRNEILIANLLPTPETFADTAFLESPQVINTLILSEFNLGDFPIGEESIANLTGGTAVLGAYAAEATAEGKKRRSLSEHMRTKLGKVVTAVAAALTFYGVSAAADATSARADTTVNYQVTGTEGEGLYIHPDAPTVDSATDGLVAEGGNIAINCWTVGSNVLGDAVWDYGTTAGGRQGYFADYYINTPDILNTDTSGLANSGLPECGDASSISTAQAPSVAAPVANTPPPAPSTPDVEPDGCSDGILLEVWGNGFYDKTNCIDATEWHPNIWLKEGSWVCAAISQATDTRYYKDSAAAAAAVDSGQVKLGAADPYRGVTCVKVK